MGAHGEDEGHLGRGRHDPYCPKSFPAHTFTDPETGDVWDMGPAKFVCKCADLAAGRASINGGEELRLALVRSKLEADGGDGAVDAERLRELDAVLDCARQTMDGEDLWRWMRSPDSDLDGTTPLDLVANGHHQQVIALLSSRAGSA